MKHYPECDAVDNVGCRCQYCELPIGTKVHHINCVQKYKVPPSDCACLVLDLKEDVVNHPKHYTTHPSGIECITIAQHMNFNLGNVLKYIWRVDEKGIPIEDLRKAIKYLEFEIERRSK